MGQLMPSFKRARFCVADEDDGETKDVHLYMFDAVSQFEYEPGKQFFELAMSSNVEESLDSQPWFELPKACTNIAGEFRNQLRVVSLPSLCDSGEMPRFFSRMALSASRASRFYKRGKTQVHQATTNPPIRCCARPIKENAILHSVVWGHNGRTTTVSEWAKLMAEESQRGVLARQLMSNVIKVRREIDS